MPKLTPPQGTEQPARCMPTPIRLDLEEDKMLKTIQARTSPKMSKSDILRRAFRLFGPKFLTGEFQLTEVLPASPAKSRIPKTSKHPLAPNGNGR